MLKELTRADWLGILNLPAERVPAVLILRGTRNLRRQYQAVLPYFTDVVEIGTPNAIFEDVLVGDVFRAVATALNLELIVEGVLPDERVTIAFRDAPPANVLNFLALAARCSWQFEPGRLIVRRL